MNTTNRDFASQKHRDFLLATSDQSTGQRTARASRRRIAIISDGENADALLSYAMDTCCQYDTLVDLLIHDAFNLENFTLLENRILGAGFKYRRIQLGANPVNETFNYIHANPALIFIVAMTDNSIAKALLDKTSLNQSGYLPVPLVLIDKNPALHSTHPSLALPTAIQ